MKKIHQRLDELQKGKQKVDEVTISTKHPFVASIMAEPLPPGFVVPQFETYSGTTDPFDHLQNFQSSMTLHGVCDAITCRSFPMTLRGAARTWYSNIQPESIRSFDQLSRLFVGQFMTSRRQRRTSDSLMALKQENGESLRKYLDRFTAATLEVTALDHSIARAAFSSGLKPSRFAYAVAENPPADFRELVNRAENHIRAEDTVNGWRNRDEEKTSKKQKNEDSRPREEQRGRNPRRDEHMRIQKNPERKFSHYTPLNTPKSKILKEIQREEWFKWPQVIKRSPKRDENQYCEYHRGHGHDTEDCMQLEDLIETQIREGFLQHFILDNRKMKDRRDEPRKGKRGRSPSQDEHPDEPTRVINVINGGLASGGTSNHARNI